jgi:hypothetical protein
MGGVVFADDAPAALVAIREDIKRVKGRNQAAAWES